MPRWPASTPWRRRRNGAEDDRLVIAMEEGAASWRAAVRVPADAVAAFEDTLAPLAAAVSSFAGGDRDEPWTVAADFAAPPDRAAVAAALAAAAAASGLAVPEPAYSETAPRDWVDENLRAFPPIRVGRYFLAGSHYAGAVPPAAHRLRVDAATAFGSGEHATTRGCLLALDALAGRRFRNPLDVGCGTGVLAMAIARTWPVDVLAADIDPEAVRVAAANVRLNGLAGRIRVIRAAGYRAAEVRRRAPYDLVVANILMRPLCRMAPDLAVRLAPGGIAVLSGFLADDARRVLAAHRPFGLRLWRRIDVGPWRTLVLQRPPRRAAALRAETRHGENLAFYQTLRVV
jgi:ribosomal protein L11 methyltransferase